MTFRTLPWIASLAFALLLVLAPRAQAQAPPEPALTEAPAPAATAEPAATEGAPIAEPVATESEPAAEPAATESEPAAEPEDAPTAEPDPAAQSGHADEHGEVALDEHGQPCPQEAHEDKEKVTLVSYLLKKLSPIVILLVLVAVVFARLPKVDGLDHITKAFSRRRVMNWFPLGLTYAFMYMGRYNLKVSKHAYEHIAGLDGSPLMANADFAAIFFWGTLVYGFAFVLNGPLTDRIGGRKAVLTGTAGVIVMNAVMGLATWSLLTQGPAFELLSKNFVAVFSVLYALNMYFQSFGAVSVVKVNASWFHVRERGVFGAIFGILISLGVYFAFDWSYFILEGVGLVWVFLVPSVLLALLWVVDLLLVRDTPGAAGLVDFNTGDASSGDAGPRKSVVEVFSMMLRNPIIMTIAFVEFASGFLRQSIMQWYRTFADQTDAVLGLVDTFIFQNWGLLLCVAGIVGGMVAGIISDRVFQSRRGPVAAVLYGIMLVSAVVLIFTYQVPAIVGVLVILMIAAVIGVHGMLSGTASMDFGGAKNVGVAVGIIDGFVYLGTAAMSFTYGIILPQEELDACGNLTGPATEPANWISWPISMVPLALLGLFLASRLWNAKPKPGSSGGH